MMWLSASLYSKCTVFTVNLCYLQVYKLNEVNHGQKCFSVLVVFLWPIIYSILSDTNNVLHSSVKKKFVHSAESSTSEKVLQ